VSRRRWIALVLAACGGEPRQTPADAGDAAPAAPDARPAEVAGCEARVFGSGVALPDLATTESVVQVPAVGSGQVRLVAASVPIRHPYPRDLTVVLVSPEGREALLGGLGADVPVAGFAGGAAAGRWTLRITDGAAGDIGTLEAWSLRVDACAPAACLPSTVEVPLSAEEGFCDGQVGVQSIFISVGVDPTATVVGARLTTDLYFPLDEQLELALWSPASTRVVLSRHNGSLGANYVGTVFDDTAEVSIVDGWAPFTGAFRPQEPLAGLAGEPAAGRWAFIAAAIGSGLGTNIQSCGGALEVDLCEMPCPGGSQPRRALADGGVIRIDEGGAVRALGLRLDVPAAAAAPRVTLVAPSGARALVLDGDSAGALSDCLFFDGASRGSPGAPDPFDPSPHRIGAFRPVEPLAPLAAGSPVGSWTIEADGPITAAALELCVEP
jgi:subtilisin-like proprotein convertase family protein